MRSFSEFSEEKTQPIIFTFGRFNPPTVGHLKLLDKVSSVAGKDKYLIFSSHSNDPKKNPLVYKDKISAMRKLFPKHARSITDTKQKTIFEILTHLYDSGYTKITLVVGSDRINEFDKLLKKYDGVKGRHGYYTFPEGIDIVSSGDRDPDSDGVSGMSASKMRAAAADEDLKSFMKGLPKGYADSAKLFNMVRAGMNLDKITNFREHVQLLQVSELREKYIQGVIFNIGDTVTSSKDDQKYVIESRKPTFIISTCGMKHWIADLTESKTSRYREILELLPLESFSKYGEQAAEARKKLAIKLSNGQYETMTVPEIIKKVNGIMLTHK